MPVILSRKGGSGGGGGAPSGPAGGDLAGTYPNPTISAGASADGLVLTSDGAGGTDFERPPGFELDYVQITAPVSVTGTTAATATTCITGSAVVYDGATRVCVEVYSPAIDTATSSLATVFVLLYDGAAQVGILGGSGRGDGTRIDTAPHFSRRYLTPTAASHTYSVRCYRGIANGTFNAGTGGDDIYLPAYLRITKA